MRRTRQYPEDDKEFAYMPDVAEALGTSGHHSFKTIRAWAERYHTETGQTIEVTQTKNYFTCVRWEELRPFAQWYREKRATNTPQAIHHSPTVTFQIPEFTGFMKERVLAASMAFGEKMVELGLPEAAFLFFEQPNGRDFSTGALSDEVIDDED